MHERTNNDRPSTSLVDLHDPDAMTDARLGSALEALPEAAAERTGAYLGDAFEVTASLAPTCLLS